MKASSCAALWALVQEFQCAVLLALIPEKHILHDMLRLFRKWRLIRRLHKECARHEAKPGDGFILMGKKVVIVKGNFAQQTASHFPWITFWGKEYKNRKSNEINSLLDSCIVDGLIEPTKRDGDDQSFIRNSFKGEDFYGHADFLQALLSKYDSSWVKVVLPLGGFVVGLSAKSVWAYLQIAYNAIARH